MKIAGEAFRKLECALIDTLKAHNLHPSIVQNERSAWDVFHAAVREGRLSLRSIYDDANDTHINTAMRKIFRL